MDRYRSPSAVRWSLLCLPSEVLEEILLSLGVPDLCRVRRVCWGLRGVVDRLWTKVATSRWMGWGSIAGSTHQEWFGLCRQRYLCECELATVFDRLSRRCYKLQFTDEDELEILSKVLDKKMFSYDILDCALSDILDVPSGIANLTEQFYALYGKEYIVRQKLIPEWRELLSLPDDQQTLEKGAVLIAQWMRPCQCPGATEIAKQLDSIAEMVAMRLLGAGAPEEGERRDVKRVRQSALVRVREEGAHSVNNILTTLNSVLYDQLGYMEAGQAYYDLENSLIDQVLERKIGIPITLCIVYEGVARRLGVRLRPVNFPNHFVLQIDTEKSSPVADPDRCIVDAYHQGQRLTVAELNLRIFRYGFPQRAYPARPVQVYIRILNNIARVVKGIDILRVIHTPSGQWQPIPLLSFLYLRTVLIPMEVHAHISEHGRTEDISACMELQYNPKMVFHVVEPTATHFFFSNVPHASVISRLRKIVEEREVMMDKAIDQKRRPITTNVKFSVGMIMKHSLYNYRCVIYGWDESCKMSEAWIVQMNVDRHPPGRHQPFYNVLAHDGTSRYAAQANLMDCPPEEMGPIPHWEVGKYFTQFAGKRYIANAPLMEEYPDDI